MLALSISLSLTPSVTHCLSLSLKLSPSQTLSLSLSFLCFFCSLSLYISPLLSSPLYCHACPKRGHPQLTTNGHRLSNFIDARKNRCPSHRWQSAKLLEPQKHGQALCSVNLRSTSAPTFPAPKEPKTSEQLMATPGDTHQPLQGT